MYRVVLPVLLLLSTATPSHSQLALTFSSNGVLVDGVSPDSELAVFAASRVGLGYFVRVEVVREVLVADEAGHAEYRLPGELAPRSVWAAVDLASGEFALAAPSIDGLSEDPFSAGAFFTSDSGEVDRLRHDHRVIEALVVRPSWDEEARGVWSLRLADGDPATDADGLFDRTVTLALGSLEPLDGGPPPSRFAVGDVVIMIDPDNLQVSAVRLEDATGIGGEL